MNQPPPLPYQCPGQSQPISKAVHLGRLARFYPACGSCPHRDDTATLSPRQVSQLRDVYQRQARATLFFEEGVSGTYLDDLRPGDVRQLAVAHGLFIRGQQNAEWDYPRVVIASDGRPLTADLLAAVSEGLRFAGCAVVDIGYATAPCLVFAMDHLKAVGGLYVGNVRGGPGEVSLKFWGGQARPLSAGGDLDQLERMLAAPLSRPIRRYGSLRRFRADVAYLACLHKYFHALRPLRIVVSTGNAQLLNYLQQLGATVACEMIPLPGYVASDQVGETLAEKVVAAKAHVGIWIDGDGEACRLVDEGGRAVTGETTLQLLSPLLIAEQRQAAVAVANSCSAATEEAIRQSGATVHRCDGSRAEMHRVLSDREGVVGADGEGRFWFHDHLPSADALKALAVLLNVLSQGDQDLSQRATAVEVVR
ncbi:MAG: hypothetical protein GTO53_05995 [Planctomycetales bacterium]|nr:hypothetical protein [Planctomycetales bacterium]NIN77293.1 hypothetical protein [Planctomycetales bacterium]NIO34481.1 hypothetical protein [Planctomycetales bacterium]NIO46281.1 hypothetical protein [Planctomycetales bacterium]